MDFVPVRLSEPQKRLSTANKIVSYPFWKTYSLGDMLNALGISWSPNAVSGCDCTHVVK